MNVAIITARGGSKRIPKKNIKPFYGRPLISYSIQAALNSGVFDEVMVSTDDEEIKKIALEYGAIVPFMRSNKTSDDYSTTADVLIEVLTNYHETNKTVDTFCCIYPTAPFLTGEKLKNSFQLFNNSDAHTMVSVCKFSYPVQRALRISEGKLSMLQPEHLNSRSQDLEPIFHDAGQFYWGKTEHFIKEPKLFSSNSMAYELSETEVQDIDSITDWQIAEIKYEKLNS